MSVALIPPCFVAGTLVLTDREHGFVVIGAGVVFSGHGATVGADVVGVGLGATVGATVGEAVGAGVVGAGVNVQVESRI